jgi:ubiquinone/menaquinone biosynthesis C-methylase UbiE
MSRRGRYVIDTMKVWASKWNLQMPVPPYDDVNYWEGVYRTMKINTDPPFEWGDMSCADLLTHTYTPIDLPSAVPALSTISLPHHHQQQQQQHQQRYNTDSFSSSSSSSRSFTSPLMKPVQVRRKNHNNKGRGSQQQKKQQQQQQHSSPPSTTTTTTTHSNAHDSAITTTTTSATASESSTHSSSSSNSTTTTATATRTSLVTTTLGEMLGNIHPVIGSTAHSTTNSSSGSTHTGTPGNKDDESILVLGCGTSQFGADLLRHQWMGPIIQLDCSSRLIESLTHHPLYKEYIDTGRMMAVHDDATVLSAVQDNTIQAVFDKGLIDAFFCTDNYMNLSNTLSSVHRVLRPNSTFCTMSLSHPKFLLPKLLPSVFVGQPTPAMMNPNATSDSSSQIVPSRFMIQQRQQQIHRLWSHIEVRLITGFMYCYRFTKK